MLREEVKNYGEKRVRQEKNQSPASVIALIVLIPTSPRRLSLAVSVKFRLVHESYRSPPSADVTLFTRGREQRSCTRLAIFGVAAAVAALRGSFRRSAASIQLMALL